MIDSNDIKIMKTTEIKMILKIPMIYKIAQIWM